MPAGSPAAIPGSPVAFDRRSLLLEGQRKLILSGSLHYFRAPDPERWQDIIQSLKSVGLNAIDTYFYWGYHSPAPGRYDFSGTRDVDRFMDLVEEAGMYLIARPGPYICAEVDGGGLPGWLIAKRNLKLRCRTLEGKYQYDPEYVNYVREWYEQIVPRIARRKNLILFQTENEYNLPAGLASLLVTGLKLTNHIKGATDFYYRLGSLSLIRNAGVRRQLEAMTKPGYLSSRPYLQDLYRMSRELGVAAPIFHNDTSLAAVRWIDVDIPGVDDYPITYMTEEWKKQDPFGPIDIMEQGVDALGRNCPLCIPEIQGGWYDGWGGQGYQRSREMLGPEAMDLTLKSCLAQGAAIINLYMAFGGTNWGLTADPDVYTSYDYGAPITEGGAISARARAIKPLADFVLRHEQDMAESIADPAITADNRQVFVKARKAPSGAGFLFLRNLSGQAQKLKLSSGQEFSLSQPDMQMVALDAQGEVADRAGLFSDRAEPKKPAFSLPALAEWSFGVYTDPIDPAFDDRAWPEVPPGGPMDLDSLGFYYGFAWYRGRFSGALPAFKLDARHCWAAFLDGQPLVACYDNFKNKLGAVTDLAKTVTVRVPKKLQGPGGHTLAILVESLGHNKGFIPDFQLPRGVVTIDTGKTAVQWKARTGLLPGESGITPTADLEQIKLLPAEPVTLPHQWPSGRAGIGLYQTTFNLSLPRRLSPVGLRLNRAPAKAVIYLNGGLIGRYWETVGPQKLFYLLPPFIVPQGKNHLLVALWPGEKRPEIGPLSLEVYP
jgi:hypothetical protein